MDIRCLNKKHRLNIVVLQGRKRLHLPEENSLFEVFILLFVASSRGNGDCILVTVQLMQRWIKGKDGIRTVSKI